MSLSSEGNISCCKVVPDDYFVPLDDVLGLSSESYTADAQNCGEKHKHNEPDVEDVLPFKKRKLDMAKKQQTRPEQRRSKRLSKEVSHSCKPIQTNLSKDSNDHDESSLVDVKYPRVYRSSDLWTQKRGFKRRLYDYYHDEGVNDGEPILKKEMAPDSDEFFREIWRRRNELDDKEPRKHALILIGNIKYSAMSEALRDQREVQESYAGAEQLCMSGTKTEPDDPRVGVSADDSQSQKPRDHSPQIYQPSSEDDELNLLWYAKQDPNKKLRQSKLRKLFDFRKAFLKRRIFLRARNASICISQKYRPMEVFDKIQRVRFQNTYGVDQTYHDLEDGWERMVPYEFENAINFDHVPYGQRSRKQLERILRSLDPEEIVVSEREYRAGESPLKYECKD